MEVLRLRFDVDITVFGTVIQESGDVGLGLQ